MYRPPYDYGYLCMISDDELGNSIGYALINVFLVSFLTANTILIGGLFVSAEWSIFVPLGYYPVVTP